jgi:hypothetical protein
MSQSVSRTHDGGGDLQLNRLQACERRRRARIAELQREIGELQARLRIESIMLANDRIAIETHYCDTVLPRKRGHEILMS